MAWQQQPALTRQQMQEKLIFPIQLDILAVVGTGLLMVSLWSALVSRPQTADPFSTYREFSCHRLCSTIELSRWIVRCGDASYRVWPCSALATSP